MHIVSIKRHGGGKIEETKTFVEGGHRSEPNAFCGHGRERSCYINGRNFLTDEQLSNFRSDLRMKAVFS